MNILLRTNESKMKIKRFVKLSRPVILVWLKSVVLSYFPTVPLYVTLNTDTNGMRR